MPSLNEILASGSSAFRRANQALIGQVQASAGKQAAPARAVDAAPPHPKPERQTPKRTLEQAARAEERSSRGPAQLPHLHFHLFRVRLLDGDNKNASIKFILDAIRYAGLITNDRECDIEHHVTQHRVSSFAQEGVGVVITYS